MAIKKIADHAGLNLIGQFVCSSSIKHMVPPRRVDALSGDVISYTSLELGPYKLEPAGREVLPTVSQHTGRFRQHWVDLACDTADEAVAVWNEVSANRRAVAELERSLRLNVVTKALAGALSGTAATAGAVQGSGA